jgi:hypothetical protein
MWTGCGIGRSSTSSQGSHVNLGDNLRIRFTRFPWGPFAFGVPERTAAARRIVPLAYAPVVLFLLLMVGLVRAPARGESWSAALAGGPPVRPVRAGVPDRVLASRLA